MAQTFNAQKTPPKKKAKQGVGGVQGVTSPWQERLKSTQEREGQNPKEGEEKNYEPDKKNSLSSMCLRKLLLPEGSNTADIWERVLAVPLIQMNKYINIKGNMNNDLKKIYMSMSDILFENGCVFN